MNIKIANHLIELRKEHHLSQEELATKLGVTRQAVSKWERGESSPDTDNLICLAKIYNISLDELLNDTVESKDIEEIKEENPKSKKLLVITEIISSASLLIIAATYITLGFLLKDNKGWQNYWFLFILFPVIPSIFDAINKRKITAFCYPLLVAGIYCGFSMIYNLWHPLWVLFLTIPVFYIIFEPIDKLLKKDE